MIATGTGRTRAFSFGGSPIVRPLVRANMGAMLEWARA
jgi:hypothetical protein